MLIKYTGQSTNRIWGELEWTPDNNHTLDVSDAQTAAELLTHPPDDFRVSPDEPLASIMDVSLVALLPFNDIVDLEGLAGANKETVAQVAKQVRRDEAEVRSWKRAASDLLKQQADEPPVEEDSDDHHDGSA